MFIILARKIPFLNNVACHFHRFNLFLNARKTIHFLLDLGTHDYYYYVLYKYIRNAFVPIDCTSEKENWMCLTCGQVRCGRYENGHALHHSTLNSQHNVCLNTATCSVFCYKCDNYVSNATQLLDNLRDEFKDDDSLSDGSNLMEESSSSSSSRSNSVSSDSGCYEEATGSDGGKTHRQLRPRKRTSSPQIEKVSPSPRKKKLMRKVCMICQ